MKIRDNHATLNGDKTVFTMPSGGLEIINENGDTLFGINLNPDGSLKINAGQFCWHNGTLFNEILLVQPVATNVITVSRIIYLTPPFNPSRPSSLPPSKPTGRKKDRE